MALLRPSSSRWLPAATVLAAALTLAIPEGRATTRPTKAATPAAFDRLLFADEFGGDAGPLPADTAWDPQEGGNGWGNRELQSYTRRPQNVALDGAGRLAITVRAERFTGPDGRTRDWTSARLQTKGRFSFTYGRMEARIKVPAGRGLWPAFWALGDDIYSRGWPECGEIDVMELLGEDPTTVYAGVHGPKGPFRRGATPPQWKFNKALRARTALSDDFHVYGAIWTPDAVTMTLDGTPYATFRRAGVPRGGRWTFGHDFHLLLNVAVGGAWPREPDRTTPRRATMLVDWVRVYGAG